MANIFRPKKSSALVPERLANQTSHPEELTANEVVTGPNAVLAALKIRGTDCRRLMLAEGRHSSGTVEEILKTAQKLGLSLRWVSKSTLNQYEHHQGVVAFFDARPHLSLEEFLANLNDGPLLVVVLDHIEDPRNLGALLRSAAAFGAKAIVIPRERAAALTPAALSAAAGGAEAVTLVRVVNINKSLEELKKRGFWVVGAEGATGKSLTSFDFPERCVLVLGSEGRGLSQLTAKTVDFLVNIPLAAGPVNSLNVSCAGAIMMYAYWTTAGPGKASD